jgi:hypothetical protein
VLKFSAEEFAFPNTNVALLALSVALNARKTQRQMLTVIKRRRKP